MEKTNQEVQNALLSEFGELYTQVLQTEVAWETRVALIKAAIENEAYIIQSEQIIHRMLEHHKTDENETAFSLETSV